jgi:hypothetical protein
MGRRRAQAPRRQNQHLTATLPAAGLAQTLVQRFLVRQSDDGT